MDASTHFFDDLGVFSLNFVEIVLECEERFHVSIPDDALGRIETIGDVTNAIVSVRAAAR
ncbi:acyl carrier protein [Pendulispora albinea]|uniref:Acyl carrier protein n=1 Tax=Pendulispora albinea TaxID=2741071 RepID=A0ABZ2M3C3_9BACT